MVDWSCELTIFITFAYTAIRKQSCITIEQIRGEQSWIVQESYAKGKFGVHFYFWKNHVQTYKHKRIFLLDGTHSWIECLIFNTHVHCMHIHIHNACQHIGTYIDLVNNLVVINVIHTPCIVNTFLMFSNLKITKVMIDVWMGSKSHNDVTWGLITLALCSHCSPREILTERYKKREGGRPHFYIIYETLNKL